MKYAIGFILGAASIHALAYWLETRRVERLRRTLGRKGSQSDILFLPLDGPLAVELLRQDQYYN